MWNSEAFSLGVEWHKVLVSNTRWVQWGSVRRFGDHSGSSDGLPGRDWVWMGRSSQTYMCCHCFNLVPTSTLSLHIGNILWYFVWLIIGLNMSSSEKMTNHWIDTMYGSFIDLFFGFGLFCILCLLLFSRGWSRQLVVGRAQKWGKAVSSDLFLKSLHKMWQMKVHFAILHFDMPS